MKLKHLFLSVLFAFSCPAVAQDEDASEPLAIPVGEQTSGEHAPAPLPPARRPGPQAIPGAPPGPRPAPMSQAKLQALRQYEAERLVIRGETAVHTAAVPILGWGWSWAWGPRHPHYVPHTTIGVAYAPVGLARGWGIYRGPERLSTIEALSIAEDPRLSQVQDTIRRKRNTARAWYTVAGVGGAATIGSIFGQAWADSRPEYEAWVTVGVVGGISTIVGLAAGSGPSADARALEYVPARTMTLAEARAMVNAYNDRLRERLGLTPADVWSIENRTPPSPR